MLYPNLAQVAEKEMEMETLEEELNNLRVRFQETEGELHKVQVGLAGPRKGSRRLKSDFLGLDTTRRPSIIS